VQESRQGLCDRSVKCPSGRDTRGAVCGEAKRGVEVTCQWKFFLVMKGYEPQRTQRRVVLALRTLCPLVFFVIQPHHLPWVGVLSPSKNFFAEHDWMIVNAAVYIDVWAINSLLLVRFSPKKAS
jgi:hypothetical protein